MRTRSLGPVADLSKADPERASTFTEPPRSQQHEADTDDDHGGRIKSASIVFGSLFRTSLRALPAPRDFDDVMDGLGAIKSSEHEHEHEISSHDEDDDDLLGSDVESGAGGAVEPSDSGKHERKHTPERSVSLQQNPFFIDALKNRRKLQTLKVGSLFASREALRNEVQAISALQGFRATTGNRSAPGAETVWLSMVCSGRHKSHKCSWFLKAWALDDDGPFVVTKLTAEHGHALTPMPASERLFAPPSEEGTEFGVLESVNPNDRVPVALMLLHSLAYPDDPQPQEPSPPAKRSAQPSSSSSTHSPVAPKRARTSPSPSIDSGSSSSDPALGAPLPFARQSVSPAFFSPPPPLSRVSPDPLRVSPPRLPTSSSSSSSSSSSTSHTPPISSLTVLDLSDAEWRAALAGLLESFGEKQALQQYTDRLCDVFGLSSFSALVRLACACSNDGLCAETTRRKLELAGILSVNATRLLNGISGLVHP